MAAVREAHPQVRRGRTRHRLVIAGVLAAVTALGALVHPSNPADRLGGVESSSHANR
ncbi:hypothetical protein [Spirillospora sp. CA-294931]|uniref:hypothetical protein n=1 Tax=Spirillospora sp. CA-294931 TaxID=3240042 RepID=UPI003D8E5774